MGKASQRKAATRRDNRDRRDRVAQLRHEQKVRERRKTTVSIFAGVGAGVIILALAIVPGVLHSRAQKAKAKVGYTAPPTKAEQAAGCTGVHNDPISPAAQHVTTPIDYAASKYGDTAGGTPPIPPSGGEHNPDPLPDAVHVFPLSVKPAPERAVHNLEHGFIVAWFDSKLPQSQVSELEKLAGSLDRFIAVGWTQGDLPAGKHVVLTSWGHTERCSRVSDAVARAFWSAHMNKPPAPEIGSPGGSNTPPSQLVPPTGAPVMSGSPAPSPTK